jgi:WhiB family transcriptional regulator, redox-sensing transcriptional regulator
MVLAPPAEWTLSAKCTGMGDEFFGEEFEQKMIRRFCIDCPVRQECLNEALLNGIEWGVWGGYTERERRRMLRQRARIAF